ncbi:hypothetical protein BYT27DRAFT_7083804 [Phlegmacium glaucopus]|nr:hypothetical protein BYT27DRAFT_7083804 [Phlegmacium glaucopus]
MLRTLTIVRPPTFTHFKSVSSLTRHYSTPTPSPSDQKNRPPNTLPTSPNKKPKIDLRPGPIKPKPTTLSSSHPPIKPTRPTSSAVNPTTKLSSAKEEVVRDINDAEKHGILIPPPPDANWFKRTLHQAIQLFKFYFRGVKLIFSRRKHIALIKARIKAGGAPLTRSEYRLIQTQKDDVNKVIPFLMIALILEEVIPLIAIYAPFMLPSTCILPSQQQRIEAKRAEKTKAFATQYKSLYGRLKRTEDPKGFLPLHSLRLEEASTAVCGLLGLSTIGINALRIRRIRRHLEFITRDDQLLMQHTASLSHRELQEALEERGIMTQGLSQQELQARLVMWLEYVKGSSTHVNAYALERRLSILISRH